MGDLFDDGPAAPKKAKKTLDHREGHRARLRTRFMAGGAAAVADYELLELVLFRAIPRRDVKPVAKRVIERFGGFAGAISADPQRLREIDGLGEAAIIELKIVEAAAQALSLGRQLSKPVLSDGDDAVSYCRARMAHKTTEEFRVLFLDRKSRLIAEEAQGRGTVDQVAVYPREVVKRALELDASAIIIAHNHPSGDPTPSKADIQMTKSIAEAARTVGVALHDHLVIGADKAVSFRAKGLL